MEREQKIVEALKRGDEAAFRYVYDRHYVLLCRMAEDFLQDPLLAEAMVEDTISHLWEIREALDIQTSLRRYLMQAVRNRCLNCLESEQAKREIRFPNLPNQQAEFRSLFERTDRHPLGYLLEKELESEIVKAVKALPVESRSVFRKSRFEHKKNEEIARELGISVNTVKYHIKKSLAFLRERLSRYWVFFPLLFFRIAAL
ncbi:RNA polymerase sigma-70 factor [Phocaeicola abscessus]|uniref:RNA polymerase sigma-70 factor n=1 Tax=Phocaeicola abscessus TaxID=555313 RepID=UPI000385AC8C|nr:RNA polymerase sigma-70 factor [Phocaeicola abscessus]EPT33099.1 RNA polymerase sigma-70 factor [Bacteroidetes bacterium oral taxon 272 str. F0290]